MNVLVAVDGSEEAENALAYATDIADAMDAAITVVHVVNPTVQQTGGTDPIATRSDADERLIVESIEDAEERAIEVIEEASAFASDLGHDVQTELLYGDPVTEITDYADEQGFDAIFVGHRGRTERANLMIGSVAKQVVERADVPVTVAR